MIDYALTHGDRLLDYSVEHLVMIFWAMLLALLLALPIIAIAYRFPMTKNMMGILTSSLYAIPSFALFALLIPISGLGRSTAIIGLAIYAQFFLVSNALTGLEEVDSSMREAALAMGMTRGQILYRVDLPLAYPSFLAGLKLALTSSTGIGTVAAAINAGGLGELLFLGLRSQNAGIMMWGIVLAILLCLLLSAGIDGVEKLINRRFPQELKNT